jgi:hypothetical protein
MVGFAMVGRVMVGLGIGGAIFAASRAEWLNGIGGDDGKEFAGAIGRVLSSMLERGSRPGWSGVSAARETALGAGCGASAGSSTSSTLISATGSSALKLRGSWEK